jgi:hypothetical protein
MPDFSKSRIGDKCFHLKFGDCVITRVGGKSVHYCQIDKDELCSTAWFDGRNNKDDVLPILYHSRPEITDPPPPKRVVKKTVWACYHIGKNGNIISSNPYDTKQEAADVPAINATFIGTFPTEIEYEEE